MSQILLHNKKTNITYVYESVSHYDPKSKQARPKRKLIGKLDESGNVVPTRGRKAQSVTSQEAEDENSTEDPVITRLKWRCEKLQEETDALRAEIRELRQMNQELQEEKNRILEGLKSLLEQSVS